jgi:hypothetical protein
MLSAALTEMARMHSQGNPQRAFRPNAVTNSSLRVIRCPLL